MTVRWSISHDERLVVAISEGALDADDLNRYLTALVEAGAQPYAKLFDMTSATVGLTAQDASALGRRVTGYGKNGPVGPVAIVVGSDLALQIMTGFQQQARAERPLRIFRDVAAAREWLDGIARPA